MLKLSESQKKAIKAMQKYPKDIIMHNGYLTGGHGVKICKPTKDALIRLGIVERDKLTEFGRIVTFN